MRPDHQSNRFSPPPHAECTPRDAMTQYYSPKTRKQVVPREQQLPRHHLRLTINWPGPQLHPPTNPPTAPLQSEISRRSGASGWPSAPAPKRAQGGVATEGARRSERLIGNCRVRATTAKMDEETRQPLRFLCVASQRLSRLPKPYGALLGLLRVNFRLPLQ